MRGESVANWRIVDGIEKNQNESSELKHYGVKGMKWGIRKEYEPKGRKSQVLNAVTLTKKTDSGNSTIKINDKAYYDLVKRTADEFGDKTPATYASEAEALYKFKNLPRFNTRLSEEQQRQAVNHNAPDYDRQLNCFECSMAYEMRRRGYNVQANKVHGGLVFETLHAFDVKDSFRLDVSSPDGSKLSSRTLAEECYRRMEDTCLRYGEGARGMVAITYAEPYSGGHAMNWVVENGEFKIIDNQSNQASGYETFLYCDSEINVFRLDNAEVLPGVTDFVEPFKPTVKEEFASKKAYSNAKKVWKKEGYADEHKESGMKVFEKIIKDVGKNVSEFVSKGKEVVTNFFKNLRGG